MALSESLVRWLVAGAARIAVIAALAWLTSRLAAAAAARLERQMATGSGADVHERAKRVQTLARIVQKTVTVLVYAMATLMILRELGVDITPVLTGAGVAGLAVGFGAQTLVRDVISGFFLIAEDQVRVGDVAVVNGQSGLVEAINLRTIVLRDFDGAVHVFPNGEVKTLANRSKDFSYYVLTIDVRVDEDIDRVSDVMRDAGQDVMADDRFRDSILAPLEVVGVDAFTQGRLVLKARIKTLPLKQWEVGRELRKRLARRLVGQGIDLTAGQLEVHVDGLDEVLKALGRAPTRPARGQRPSTTAAPARPR